MSGDGMVTVERASKLLKAYGSMFDVTAAVVKRDPALWAEAINYMHCFLRDFITQRAVGAGAVTEGERRDIDRSYTDDVEFLMRLAATGTKGFTFTRQAAERMARIARELSALRAVEVAR